MCYLMLSMKWVVSCENITVFKIFEEKSLTFNVNLWLNLGWHT